MRLRVRLVLPSAVTVSWISMIAASRHTRTSLSAAASSVNNPASLDSTGFCRSGSRSPSTGSYGSGSSPGLTRISVMFGANVSGESGRFSSGLVSAMADWSPRCSMSNALREARLMMRSVSWAGQDSTFGQRMSLSPSLAGASFDPQDGQRSGMTNSRRSSSRPLRRSTTGPTSSGITSPALRTTTVSPISTPLRLTSNGLCNVVRDTVDPATYTGLSTATGVTRPVRPTCTVMSSSSVLTSSGGYL